MRHIIEHKGLTGQDILLVQKPNDYNIREYSVDCNS